MPTTALQIKRLREGLRPKGPLITANLGSTCWLAARLHMHNQLDASIQLETGLQG